MSFHSKKLRIDLATARDNSRIDVRGGFLRIVAASSGNATIDIAVDNNVGSNDQFGMKKRDALTYGPSFEKLYITNTAQAGEWIEIAISPSKDIFDFEVGQNFVVDAISSTVVTQETKAATLDSLADIALTNGVATILTAADAARREITVTNILANGVSMRVGDSGAGASNGIELQIGDSVTLSTKADVYAYIVGVGKFAAVTVIKD